MGEPHELEEGWVVVLKNGLRLKVHTEAAWTNGAPGHRGDGVFLKIKTYK